MTQKRKVESPSDQLRRHIESCGLTKAELAEQSGVDPGQLSRFMTKDKTKRRSLSLDTIDQLSAVLQLELTMHGPSKATTPAKRKA